jgi:hypothetical protein
MPTGAAALHVEDWLHQQSATAYDAVFAKQTAVILVQLVVK